MNKHTQVHWDPNISTMALIDNIDSKMYVIIVYNI